MTARPEIAPAFLAELTGGVPSRLLKKLDKKPELAEGWTWSASGEGTRIETDKDAVVTIRGRVVATEDDLVCTCLLAPKCLHRLAVATRLPLAGEDAAAEAEGDDASATDANALEDDALLAPAPVTPDERAAARRAVSALAALVSAGVRNAGATVQADLLRAIHDAREAKLHRLAALLLLTLGRVRGMREGEPVHIDEVVAVASEGLSVAFRVADEEEVSLVERGLGRRAYRELPPTPLWGFASMPLWTRTGYSGVITWLVDKAGTVFTANSLTPSDGRGGSSQLPVFQNVSLTHTDISRGQVVLQHGTRSFDRRLGAGKKVEAVVVGPSSLFEGPVAKLFDVPVSDQVARFWAEHERPTLLRRAGWDLLMADALVLGGASDGEVAMAVGGQTIRALAPSSGEASRENWRRVAEAAGARVRIVGRLLADRERALRLVSVAHPGHEPERWDVGFDETQLGAKSKLHGALRDLLAAAKAAPAPDDEAPPEPLSGELMRHPWSTLERVLAQAADGGWRTLPAAREAELRADQATLRGLGLVHGADLLEALRTAALPRGRHHSGRLLAPDPEPFAAALAASETYLRALAETRRKAVWG